MLCHNSESENAGEGISGCDRDDCTCHPRCISCSFHFVENPHSLCSVCAPIECFNCNRNIETEERVYILPGDLAKGRDFTYKRGGTCRKCRKKVPVNSRSICFKCQTEDHFVCEDCKNEKACTECGKLHYNKGALCSSCKEDLVLCPSCRRREFIPTANQVVCLTCFHQCAGCLKSFSPQSKTEQICKDCNTLIDENRCTNCGTHQHHLDNRGHCTTCSGIKYELIDSHTPQWFCSVCKVSRVDHDLGVCLPCATGRDECPSCNKLKPITEYLCSTCLKKNSNGRRKSEDAF